MKILVAIHHLVKFEKKRQKNGNYQSYQCVPRFMAHPSHFTILKPEKTKKGDDP
jgi:hypothetical protein